MNAMQPPQVRLGDWISEGWKMFTSQWKGWIVNSLLYFLFIAMPIVGLSLILFLPAMLNPRDAEEVMIVITPIYILASIVLGLVSIIPTAGMFRSAMKQAAGGRVEVRDLWSEAGKFPRIIGAAFLIGLMYLIGAMLCVIPGLLVAGAFQFTIPLIIDRNLSIGEALRMSKEATRPNIVMFTVFLFVVALIGSVGTYACYIGLLATLPLQFTMMVAAYKDVFGLSGSSPALPQPQPFTPPTYSTPAPEAYSPPSFMPPPSPSPSPASGPGTASATSCPNCQASLPPTAVFCPRCGTSVKK